MYVHSGVPDNYIYFLIQNQINLCHIDSLESRVVSIFEKCFISGWKKFIFFFLRRKSNKIEEIFI